MFLEPGAEFSSYSLNISIAFAPGGGGRLTPTLAFARSTSRSGPTAGDQGGGLTASTPAAPAEVALIVRMRSDTSVCPESPATSSSPAAGRREADEWEA
jgi:hypothetical protein